MIRSRPVVDAEGRRICPVCRCSMEGRNVQAVYCQTRCRNKARNDDVRGGPPVYHLARLDQQLSQGARRALDALRPDVLASMKRDQYDAVVALALFADATLPPR